MMSNHKPSEWPLGARGAALFAAAALAAALTACTSQLDLAAPAVHDMPAPRDTRPMSAEERQRITDELNAARERQEAETTGTIPARPQRAR